MSEPALSPQKARLFRIVHVECVPWILDHGIHCRSSAKQDPGYINIGNAELAHYVSGGVDELAREKLTPLLRLRYGASISDAVADLGPPAEIGRAFSDFQKYLYAEAS